MDSQPTAKTAVLAIAKLLEADPSSEAWSRRHLKSWCELRGRTLTPSQLRDALKGFSRSLEALYGEVGGVYEAFAEAFDVPYGKELEVMKTYQFNGADALWTKFSTENCYMSNIAEQIGNIRGFRKAIDATILSLDVPRQAFQKVFLSYADADYEFAEMVFDALEAKGVECFFAPRHLRVGDSLQGSISTALRSADRLLFCCSEAGLKSEWVLEELTSIRERERKATGSPNSPTRQIIPLDLDGSLFKPGIGQTHGLGPVLRDRLVAPFVGWKADLKVFDAGISEVLRALQVTDG